MSANQDLTRGNILGKLLRFFFPILLGMLEEAESAQLFLCNTYNTVSIACIHFPRFGRGVRDEASSLFGRGVRDEASPLFGRGVRGEVNIARPKVAGEQVAYHFRPLGHEETFFLPVLLPLKRAHQLNLVLGNHTLRTYIK